jgi:hypothetical protein
VLYAVAANSGGARSGSLTVAGLSFKVDQAASGGSSGAGLTVKDVSGTPGKPVELSILFASGGAAVSAIQFTCAYDPQIVTFVSARAGDQLLAAGKSITVTGSSGQLRAVGAGLNQNRINDGIAAFFTFNINSTFPTNGKTTVSCSNVQFVDAQGQAISATGGAGTITASTGCDVNGNGQFEIADVQLIINEALGILPPIHGRNDGKVDIVDVQIVINAVLGLGCNR